MPMIELSRTIRFCLSQGGGLASDAPADNTFAAWPPMRGLGAYYELVVVCRGEPDPVTGFFMNIKEIDRAARIDALPLVARGAQSHPPAAIGRLLVEAMGRTNAALDGSVVSVELRLTPTYRIRVESHDMQHAYVSQRFEFSAAHRLHSGRLTPGENLQTFGKCNNPAGHGHNYRLEVTVRCPIGSDGQVVEAESLDALVEGSVVEKLDHKNLDVDVEQFAGINTTVENISRVVYEMLADAMKGRPYTLDQVRVWETGKTVCTYRQG